MAEDNVHRQIERIRQTTRKIRRNFHIICVLGGTELFLGYLMIFVGLRFGVGAGAMFTVVLAVLFLAWYSPPSPNLYCPHCSRPIFSTLFWVCGNCAHENKPGWFVAHLHLYTEKCGHCGRIPTGLICPDCNESIVFDEHANAGEQRIAHALGWEPSSERARSEEPKAEERKPSAGERLRERMAKMRERLTDTGDLDATFEEEMKKLKAELSAGEITEDQYKIFENDLKDFVHQERVWETLRENDEE